jgi:hypothetical protein
MTGKRKRRRGAWQGIFDSANRLIGFIEEDADAGGPSWRVIVHGKELGRLGSREAALALAKAIAGTDRGGADDRRR